MTTALRLSLHLQGFNTEFAQELLFLSSLLYFKNAINNTTFLRGFRQAAYTTVGCSA